MTARVIGDTTKPSHGQFPIGYFEPGGVMREPGPVLFVLFRLRGSVHSLLCGSHMSYVPYSSVALTQTRYPS